MQSEEWDEAGLRASIPTARQQVEIAAAIYARGPDLPDWDSHRPLVEFMFYIARLDYDFKVLICQVLSDADNRTVWEPFLALELYTALFTLPAALNRARAELGREGTASGWDADKFDTAAAKPRQAIKNIKGEVQFMEALRFIRNGVAAHHGLTNGRGMDEAIAWTYTSNRLAQTGGTPFDSQIVEHAVRLTLSLHDFAAAR